MSKNCICVHLDPNYFGNRLYVFTKDPKHCIAVEYVPEYDFGKGSPSGARIDSVEIHTNNGFVFNEKWQEVSLSEIPECILELMTYLIKNMPYGYKKSDMYVESDSRNRTIIQDLTSSETSFIQECICSYLSGSQTFDTPKVEFLTDLKKQLETNTQTNG